MPLKSPPIPAISQQHRCYRIDAAYMVYEHTLNRYHRRRGNDLPKFNLKTLRITFEKASQKTWKYERPYKLAGCNDEKNYEQVLERIDDTEAGRIWELSPTTRM